MPQSPTAEAVEHLACVLELSGRTIRVELAVPQRPMRLAELTEAVLPLADALVRDGVAHDRPVSCRKGCASCCRQLVPLSAPEAFWLAERVATLDPAVQSTVRARWDQVHRALESSWIGYALRHRLAEDPKRATELAVSYHAFGLACPLLEGEACLLYRDRPLTCREYVVTTPADHCATPGRRPVRRVPLPLATSEALGRLAEELLGPHDPVAIPTALHWVASHADDAQRTWPGRALLERLISILSTPSA